MIYKVTFYSAKCDHCCLDWLHDDNEFAAMIEEDQMLDVVENDNWHTDGEKLYCCDCWTYNDDDEIVLIESRKNLHNKESEIEVRACDTEEFYNCQANSDANCHDALMTKEFFESRFCNLCKTCVYNDSTVKIKRKNLHKIKQIKS